MTKGTEYESKKVAANCHNSRSRSHLLCKTQLERELWVNEFVYTGYREPYQSKSAYLKSIIEWNNETINIWSHLLGFIYFSWFFYDANINSLPRFAALISDHIVVSLCIIGAQICMLLSATYHIFGCASVKERKRWLRYDIFGISAGLISIYLSGIYLAFFCFEEWRTNYFTMLCGLFIFITYLPSRSDLFDAKIYGSRIGYLHLAYIIIAAFGICPTIHWISLHGGSSNSHVMAWLPNVFILYGLLGFGFTFYATMIPERFIPGMFDVIGCSHQWWHWLILAAMIFWHRAGIELLGMMRSMPEFCHHTTSSSNTSFVAY
uniref:HlyIII-domain-containing protein n=1 Tax=Ascaris lumbricoides TaxID=6252 RepID=A0A0M3IG14_ASCLU